MRRRVYPRLRAGVDVRVVPVPHPVALVTLDDPGAVLDAAEIGGAYVRLRPPEGTSLDTVAEWRSRVTAHARAVKVLPVRHDDDVPLALTRVNADVGNLDDEARSLAREHGDERVIALVDEILTEVPT